MRIILPKTLCEIDPGYGPLFFLAGPVRGGDDWQAACCKSIRQRISNFYAALPCHYPESHPLIAFRTDNRDHFERQLSWERHYLELAAQDGCLIFWLPRESVTNPRREGSYAMDTRGELGEWRGRMMSDPSLHMVIGAEADFPGLSQIQRNFNEALGMAFLIHKTLEDTVAAAVAKVL